MEGVIERSLDVCGQKGVWDLSGLWRYETLRAKGSWMGQTGTSHLFVHCKAKQLLLKGEEDEVWKGSCLWISKQISLEQQPFLL